VRAFRLRFVGSITPLHMSLDVMSTSISKVTMPNASAHLYKFTIQAGSTNEKWYSKAVTLIVSTDCWLSFWSMWIEWSLDNYWTCYTIIYNLQSKPLVYTSKKITQRIMKKNNRKEPSKEQWKEQLIVVFYLHRFYQIWNADDGLHLKRSKPCGTVELGGRICPPLLYFETANLP
jgi:hypothetical protein